MPCVTTMVNPPKDFQQEDSIFDLTISSIEEAIKRFELASEVESLEERFLQRENFFALVTHDMRSPLTVAKTSAEMIKKNSSRPEVCERLAERIVSTITRADKMITDLLDANRIQAGLKLSLTTCEFDFATLAEQVCADIALISSVEIRYLGIKSLVGRWDQSGIRRAMENLVTNAVKYGDNTMPITVQVEVEESTVFYSVHNYGNPISDVEMKRLFGWHCRGVESINNNRRGWGLGLMLVKGIVEAHGGRVGIKSSIQDGTRFTIEIPRVAIH